MNDNIKVTLQNKFYNEEVVIDTASFEFVLQEVDFGEVSANHTTVSDNKGYGYKNTSTSFDSRVVSIIGWVVGKNITEVETRKKVLRRLINPLHVVEVIADNYKLKTKPDNSINFAKKMDIQNNEYMCKFMINLTAFYPFWVYKEEEVVTASKPEGVKLFVMEIPEDEGIIFGKVAANDLSYIYNEGDIDAGVILYIYARDGSISDVRFSSLTVNEFIFVDYEMSINDTMIISTTTGDKYIKVIKADGDEIDITNKMSDDSSLFQLIPGGNDLDITSINSSNMQLSISRTPSFMEVYV